MDTDSFIVYIKTDHTYKDIAKDFETRFDTLNYQLDRPIPKEKKKKVVSLVKNELGKKIMKEFLGLRTETSSYLIDGGSVDKKAKCTKQCVKKENLNLKIINIIQNFKIK